MARDLNAVMMVRDFRKYLPDNVVVDPSALLGSSVCKNVRYIQFSIIHSRFQRQHMHVNVIIR